MNLQKCLNIELTGKLRADLEATLLPYAEWKNHPEMPVPCWDVVTGEAFYCGCEAIGFNEQNGWYLALWTPSDDRPPSQPEQPLGNGLTVVRAEIVGGPTAKDPGRLTLLFMERGTLSVEDLTGHEPPAMGEWPR